MAVDLSGSIFTLYKDARKRADNAKERGASEEAAKYYATAARWMRSYADCTHDPGIRK